MGARTVAQSSSRSAICSSMRALANAALALASSASAIATAPRRSTGSAANSLHSSSVVCCSPCSRCRPLISALLAVTAAAAASASARARSSATGKLLPASCNSCCAFMLAAALSASAVTWRKRALAVSTLVRIAASLVSASCVRSAESAFCFRRSVASTCLAPAAWWSARCSSTAARVRSTAASSSALTKRPITVSPALTRAPSSTSSDSRWPLTSGRTVTPNGSASTQPTASVPPTTAVDVACEAGCTAAMRTARAGHRTGTKNVAATATASTSTASTSNRGPIGRFGTAACESSIRNADRSTLLMIVAPESWLVWAAGRAASRRLKHAALRRVRVRAPRGGVPSCCA